MTPVERTRIEELLQDPSLSFRAIARATGYSDHTIRRVSRHVTNDPRPMRQRLSRSSDDEGSPITGWLVLGGLVLGVAFAIWVAARSAPLESPDFSTGFYPESSTERRRDET